MTKKNKNPFFSKIVKFLVFYYMNKIFEDQDEWPDPPTDEELKAQIALGTVSDEIVNSYFAHHAVVRRWVRGEGFSYLYIRELEDPFVTEIEHVAFRAPLWVFEYCLDQCWEGYGEEYKKKTGNDWRNRDIILIPSANVGSFAYALYKDDTPGFEEYYWILDRARAAFERGEQDKSYFSF